MYILSLHNIITSNNGEEDRLDSKELSGEAAASEPSFCMRAQAQGNYRAVSFLSFVFDNDLIVFLFWRGESRETGKRKSFIFSPKYSGREDTEGFFLMVDYA